MKPLHRFATLSTAAVFAFSALSLPAAASATPVLVEDPTSSTCVVTGGDLQWGVKESFRSYISGTIANGGWTVADGASYETPLFSWSNPVGEVDAVTGEGSVSFTGSVHFAGHDNVLNLVISNPTIVLNGDGTGQLLLDVTSNNVQGELVIDEAQVFFSKLEGIDTSDPASGAMSLTDVSAVLTADGAKSFGEFYSSGDEIDPLAISLQFAPCAGSPATPPAEDEAADAPEAELVSAEAPASDVPWIPIIVGGVALIVIGVTAGMLIAGRKKAAGGAEAEAPSDGSE